MKRELLASLLLVMPGVVSSGVCRAAPAKAAPPAHTAKPASPQKVVLRGGVGARVKGAPVPFVFLGEFRHFDLVLEPARADGAAPPKKARPPLRVRCQTDAHGGFAFPPVVPGNYLLRVILPTMPVGLDNAELYRAVVPVRPQGTPLDLRIPFLSLRIADAAGGPLAWESLHVRVQREGPALRQQWESGFAKRPGANPTGPLEEKGGILVEIQGRPGEVSVGFTWQAHDRGFVILPLVEEDGPVDYQLSLTAPGQGACTLRFDGSRGQSPVELEARLLPLANVAGRVRLEGVPGDPTQVEVTVTVYPEDDHRMPIASETVRAAADGSFSLANLPRGAAWISAHLTASLDGKQEELFGAGTTLTLTEKPSSVELRITRTSQQEFARANETFFRVRPARKPAAVAPQPGRPNPNGI